MGRPKLLSDDELLAVARAVFVEGGIGSSTRAIARRAGVSEAVLFQRFGTKAELFFAAMIPPAPDLHAILTGAAPSEEPSRRLEEIALRVRDYFRSVVPIVVPLLAHPDFSYEAFVQRHPDAPLGQLVGGLQRWFEGLEAEGVVLQGRAGVLALSLVGSMAGVALFERMGAHDGTIADSVVLETARLLWSGAAAR